MAKTRVDEVLGKALASDSSVVPRFTIKDPNGNVIAQNATIELDNPITTAGMAVDKQAMDECLAASGVTAGSATAYTLSQSNFTLFDGAQVRIRLHVASGATPTLNVNGTGAKALMQSATKPFKAGVAAGTWVTFIYSSALGFFLQQGSGGGDLNYGNDVNQISTYELATRGEWSSGYNRLLKGV